MKLSHASHCEKPELLWTHLSPHSFFIMSSTFLQCSAGVIWALPLAANLAAYISANCFRVKAQPWSPEPKPTVPMTGST